MNNSDIQYLKKLNIFYDSTLDLKTNNEKHCQSNKNIIILLLDTYIELITFLSKYDNISYQQI
jgi:hypothetical protein